MPIKRIGDLPGCQDEDHTFKRGLLGPGIYEHTCPRCKKKTTFTVSPKDRWDKQDRQMPEPWPGTPYPYPPAPYQQPFIPYYPGDTGHYPHLPYVTCGYKRY